MGSCGEWYTHVFGKYSPPSRWRRYCAVFGRSGMGRYSTLGTLALVCVPSIYGAIIPGLWNLEPRLKMQPVATNSLLRPPVYTNDLDSMMKHLTLAPRGFLLVELSDVGHPVIGGSVSPIMQFPYSGHGVPMSKTMATAIWLIMGNSAVECVFLVHLPLGPAETTFANILRANNVCRFTPRWILFLRIDRYFGIQSEIGARSFANCPIYQYAVTIGGCFAPLGFSHCPLLFYFPNAQS